MFASIEELIPHRAPMRFVGALTTCTETTATATARFDEKDFCITDGRVLESALIECAAQTVAAALGHRMRAKGNADRANHGMLAAVSNFRVHTRPVAGEPLTIEIRELKRLGPMLLVAATLTREGHTVATGELSLYA
jgi:predicted hotdog family 3-hydroxylacyl-ACP dehydratase